MDFASNQSNDFEVFLPKVDKLLHKVWLAHLATVEPLGLEHDLGAHRGVVCVAVCGVVRMCVKNVFNGSSSDQNESQLVPVL